MQDLEDLVVPSTRFTEWRLRSRVCAVIDLLVAAGGAGVLAFAAVDSVVSWPSNRVVADHRQLSRVAGIVLGPGWPWLLVSFAVVFGVAQRRRDHSVRAPRWPVRWPLIARVGLAVAAALCIAVVAGGSAVGAAKGEARVLPGPRYQVSTIDLNQAKWTSVSADQYDLWQARFVREDGMFTLFGLGLAAGSLSLFHLHRRVTRVRRD